MNILWPAPQGFVAKSQVITGESKQTLSACLKLLRSSNPPNIILSGPQGAAKTSMAEELAFQLKAPLLSFDCSADRRDYHLRGFISPREGEIVFVPGSLPTAIHFANTVGSCVLVMEEINSLREEVQKELNGVTDWRRSAYIPEIGEVIRLREGAKLYVLATMNPNINTGVGRLNHDLRDRFLELTVNYMEAKEEGAFLLSAVPAASKNEVDSLVRLFGNLRKGNLDYEFSTRQLLLCVQLITEVPDERERVLTALANKVEGAAGKNFIQDRIRAV